MVRAISNIQCLYPGRSNDSAEHLQEFMSETTNVSERLTIAYMELQQLITKPLEAQTTKNPDDTKKSVITTLRPTYLCLQCSSVSSVEDRDSHCQAKKHQLCSSPHSLMLVDLSLSFSYHSH